MNNTEFILSISKEGEQWKDVVGFENCYMVSSLGRICSKDRYISDARRIQHLKPRLMQSTPTWGGYYYVTLCNHGHQKRMYVHKIVAETFLPNPNNYPEVDHLDTDRSNNDVSNLKWVTKLMNMQNPKTKQNCSKWQKGKLNSSWNITKIVQLKNNEVIKVYNSLMDAVRDGFCLTTIQRCLYGKVAHPKNFTWKYYSDYIKETLPNQPQ